MCWRSASEYELYRRTMTERPGRSLFGWLRDLWRARRPQVVKEGTVVSFPAEAAAKVGQETDRGRRSKAA